MNPPRSLLLVLSIVAPAALAWGMSISHGCQPGKGSSCSKQERSSVVLIESRRTSSSLAPAPFPTPTPTYSATSEGLEFPGQSHIVLQKSGPIKATYHGQVIENLWVEASGTKPGIDVTGFDGVVIRNVVVQHSVGVGIQIAGAANVAVENVRVMNTAAPARGPHTGDQAFSRNNIVGEKALNLRVTKAYLERGSSGIYLLESKDVLLREIQGFDFRGPYPRGQLVQFDKCTNPVLDTFSVVNPGNTAWTEDAVNSYASLNPIIRNGYIEGVNSPTGQGVIIENDTGGSGGLVENVDVRFWVNGAFMAAGGSRGVTFRNVRAYDGLALAVDSDNAGKTGADGAPLPSLEEWAGENFRGAPSSGQQAFFAYNSSNSIVYERAGYSNLPRRNRVAWDLRLMQTSDFYKTREGPRPAFTLP